MRIFLGIVKYFIGSFQKILEIMKDEEKYHKEVSDIYLYYNFIKE
jgi:hypothetical protein